MVDCNEILVIVELLVGKVVLALIDLYIILKDGDNLLENHDLLGYTDHVKDLVDCLFVVEDPTV